MIVGVTATVRDNVSIYRAISTVFVRNVAGLNEEMAAQIVAYRKQYGPFVNLFQLVRAFDLRDRVARARFDGMFEQAGGFLKIYSDAL